MTIYKDKEGKLVHAWLIVLNYGCLNKDNHGMIKVQPIYWPRNSHHIEQDEFIRDYKPVAHQ